MAAITAGQCRAARALLGWSQRDLEVRARVSRKAIADFEREASTPYQRTIRDIVETLEGAGVVFQAPQDGIIGAGVALKWGVEPKLGLAQGGDTTGKPDNGFYSHVWEDEFGDATTSEAELSEDDRQFLEYARTAPHLSDRGREILMRDALKR
jgi:transcriptional regulator with XRE-family HTH domain